MKNNKFLQSDFVKIVGLVFIMAGLISIFLILNPGINEIIKSKILRLSKTAQSLNGFSIRGFGLSDSLLYGYPIALALGMCFISENIKNKFFIPIFSIILLIPILFNARIGLIPFIVYLVYITIIKKNIKLLFAIIAFIITIYIVLDHLGIIEQYSFFRDWVLSSFYDTTDLLNPGKAQGNYSVLGDMIRFPKNLLIGTGEYIYGKNTNSADIGFILQIFYGGIIYVLLISVFILQIIIRAIKKLSLSHWFPIITFLTIIISNIKGNFISSNPGLHTILLFYVFYILFDNNIVATETD